MIPGFSIGEFFAQFLGHELIKKFLGSLGEVAGENISKTLTAKMGGLGVTDEVLYWEACSTAMQQPFNVSIEQISRITAVIHKLKPAQKAEVIRIIGFSESETTTEKEIPQEKGKPIKEKKTEKNNVRGAAFILMLSGMDDKQITAFLHGSGATTTTVDNIANTVDDIAKRVKKLLKKHAPIIKGINDRFAPDSRIGRATSGFLGAAEAFRNRCGQ